MTLLMGTELHFGGDECPRLVVVIDAQFCEYTKNQGTVHLKNAFFWYVNYISIKKKSTPQPNRAPWAHPVQCQPHEVEHAGNNFREDTDGTAVGRHIP